MKLVLFICASVLFTLESLTSENIFTLNEVIERAVAVSPNLDIVNKELDISLSQVKKARAEKFPKFESAVVSGGIFTVIRADFFQPIYTFGKISSAEGAAIKGVEAANAKINESRNDTVEQATTAYYNLQLAHTLNDLVAEGKDRSQKLLKSVEDLVSGGSPKANQMDKLNLKILLSNINKNVVSSEKEIKLSRAVLKRMLVIEDVNAFDIDSHSLKPIEFEVKNLNYYSEKALKESPQIQTLDAVLDAKSFLIQKAKSEYYPTFFFGGTLRYNQSTFFEDTFVGGAGVGIRQVLNFSIAADITEAKAEYSKSLKERDVALKEVDFEIEKAFLETKENRDNLDHEKEGFEAARTLLRNASSNYNLGIGNANEIIKALGTYLKESAEYHQAVYLHNISVAHLKGVTGNSEY